MLVHVGAGWGYTQQAERSMDWSSQSRKDGVQWLLDEGDSGLATEYLLGFAEL